MTEITIRPAEKKDLKKMVNLFWGLTRYNLRFMKMDENWQKRREKEARKALQNKDGIIFLAEDANEKEIGYGYAFVSQSKKLVTIEELFVKEKYQNQGVGTRLLEKIEEWSEQFDFKIKLGIYPWNKKALEFYKKRGYKVKFLTLEKK